MEVASGEPTLAGWRFLWREGVERRSEGLGAEVVVPVAVGVEG